MPEKNNKTPYGCGFCRERLLPLELRGADFLCLCVLIRSYQCPHCFQRVYRPVSWIGRLPIISRLTKYGSARNSSHRETTRRSRRRGFGILHRGVVAMGRTVCQWERLLTEFVVAVFRRIRAVLWYVPGLIARKWNGHDRADSEFLKSSR